MNLNQKKINSLISNHEKVVNFLKEKNNLKKINTFITVLYKILKNNGTVFWCGNGGSAADCQHLSAELIGRFKINRKPYRSISLTTDTSAITAISNDFSYEEVFSRQLEGLGTKKDLLFVFSTSGNSKNIINAMITAKRKNMKIIALLGNNGGKCKKYSTNNIVIKTNDTPRIQEAHTLIGHAICEIVESLLSKKRK